MLVECAAGDGGQRGRCATTYGDIDHRERRLEPRKLRTNSLPGRDGLSEGWRVTGRPALACHARPQWQRRAPGDGLTLARDQLKATPAQIDDPARSGNRGIFTRRAPIRERGFLLACDGRHAQACLILDSLQEYTRVGRAAHTFCRDTQHDLGAVLTRDNQLALDSGDRSLGALGTDSANFRNVGSQTRQVGVVGERMNALTARVRSGDSEVNGVAARVDRRDRLPKVGTQLRAPSLMDAVRPFLASNVCPVVIMAYRPRTRNRRSAS